MSNSENAQTIRDLYALGLSDDPADVAAAEDLLSDDFMAWHPGTGWLGKEAHIKLWGPAKERFERGCRMQIRSLVSWDDRVAVEMAVIGGGADSVATYFFDMRDGKVLRERIYRDGSTASAVFAEHGSLTTSGQPAD